VKVDNLSLKEPRNNDQTPVELTTIQKYNIEVLARLLEVIRHLVTSGIEAYIKKAAMISTQSNNDIES
jgi:hypothetical protein